MGCTASGAGYGHCWLPASHSRRYPTVGQLRSSSIEAPNLAVLPVVFCSQLQDGLLRAAAAHQQRKGLRLPRRSQGSLHRRQRTGGITPRCSAVRPVTPSHTTAAPSPQPKQPHPAPPAPCPSKPHCNPQGQPSQSSGAPGTPVRRGRVPAARPCRQAAPHKAAGSEAGCHPSPPAHSAAAAIRPAGERPALLARTTCDVRAPCPVAKAASHRTCMSGACSTA